MIPRLQVNIANGPAFTIRHREAVSRIEMLRSDPLSAVVKPAVVRLLYLRVVCTVFRPVYVNKKRGMESVSMRDDCEPQIEAPLESHLLGRVHEGRPAGFCL